MLLGISGVDCISVGVLVLYFGLVPCSEHGLLGVANGQVIMNGQTRLFVNGCSGQDFF